MTSKKIEFNEATTPEAIIQCQGIRAIVFWEGQKIPFSIDQDGLDSQAIHILGTCDNEPAATARLRLIDKGFKVERIAVRPCFRGLGIGHRLMEFIDSLARQKELLELKLNAQAYLEAFYGCHGYETIGEPFIEADIEHVAMRKALNT